MNAEIASDRLVEWIKLTLYYLMATEFMMKTQKAQKKVETKKAATPNRPI